MQEMQEMWLRSLGEENPMEEEKATHSNILFFIFIFLDYESMITYLQEVWKIQNKVTYSSTIYYNFFR